MAFLLAIFAALGTAVWEGRIARNEAMRASAVRDFLVSVFDTVDADQPRDKRPSVEDLVDDASERALRDTALAGGVRSDLLLTLARVNGALGAFDREHALLDRVTPDIDRDEAPDSELRIRARLLRAGALVSQQKAGAAVALLEPLRATLDALGNARGVEGLIALADALAAANRADDAQAVYAQAQSAAARIPPSQSDEWLLRTSEAQAHALVYAQHFADGLRIADAAWMRWQAQRREPTREVLSLLNSIARGAQMSGDLKRAETAFREAITLAESLYSRPHRDIAWQLGVYGSFLESQSRYDEAQPYIERALALRRNLLGDADPDTLNGLAALGRLRSGQGRTADAYAAFGEGTDICRREKVHHSVCPRLLGSLSQMQAMDGNLAAAGASARGAVDMQRELTGADSAALVAPLGFLARVQADAGEFAGVLSTTDDLLNIAEHNGNKVSKDVRYARLQRARALFGLDRNVEALDLITAVIAEHKTKTPDEKATLFSMLTLQARALSRAQRYDTAKSVAGEALAIEHKPHHLDPKIIEGLGALAQTGKGY
jgi:serine/threonine-protein kinase